MNIAVLKETLCFNIIEAETMKTAKTLLKAGAFGDADDVEELPDGFGIGDRYIDGQWTKALPSPGELRKREYATKECVEWWDSLYTIDAANLHIWQYEAENIDMSELKQIVHEQKEIIRAKYPDDDVRGMSGYMRELARSEERTELIVAEMKKAEGVK
ncbi:MAG: hypothetical protein FWH17_06110 [Oscillospiraceae bacterium]|nr:hypothetical protein [Oscillospiraceae bacterium]